MCPALNSEKRIPAARIRVPLHSAVLSGYVISKNTVLVLVKSTYEGAELFPAFTRVLVSEGLLEVQPGYSLLIVV